MLLYHMLLYILFGIGLFATSYTRIWVATTGTTQHTARAIGRTRGHLFPTVFMVIFYWVLINKIYILLCPRYCNENILSSLRLQRQSVLGAAWYTL